MPKVKYCVPVPPPNLARDLIQRYKRALGYTAEDIGKLVGMTPGGVRNKIAKGVWTTDEFRAWCLALGITDPAEVGKAVLNRT